MHEAAYLPCFLFDLSPVMEEIGQNMFAAHVNVSTSQISRSVLDCRVWHSHSRSVSRNFAACSRCCWVLNQSLFLTPLNEFPFVDSAVCRDSSMTKWKIWMILSVVSLYSSEGLDEALTADTPRLVVPPAVQHKQTFQTPWLWASLETDALRRDAWRRRRITSYPAR